MPSNFPTSLDVLNNPTSTTSLNDVNFLHADQHANANDAIEAIESIIGITGSAVTTSLEYRLAAKAPIASPTFTGTVGGVTAAMVGAPAGSGTSTGTNTGDNATNTQYSGLAAEKAPIASPTFTGTVGGVTAAMVGAPAGSGTSTGTNTGDNATNTQYSGLAASKQDTLVSATNIKTINSTTLLGSGDLAVEVAGAAATAETNAKAYADSIVLGLWDDRGTYNASVNTFPASGGSGTAGAILKGDVWTINVAGTLGGTVVNIGDIVRSLVDTPGQTSSNWAIQVNAIAYIAENVTNKVTSISGASTDTQYPSAKLTYDQLALKAPLISPSFTTPALGTPSSGALDNCTSNTEAAANNSTQLATTAYADRLTAGTLAGAFTSVSTSGTASQCSVQNTDNTATLKYGMILTRGTGAGSYGNITSHGDTVNGVASIGIGFTGGEVAVVSPTGLTVTGTLSAASVNAKSMTGLWHQTIADTTSSTAGVGGGLSFVGYKTGTSALGLFGAIAGYKTNSTGGDENGGTRLYASNGSTLIAVADVSSTGLAVTGTLSATTGIAVGGATPGTGGVAFPATAVAVTDPNTLDDYEEGTWTPAYGTGFSSLTYVNRSATYTKIGRFVTLNFYMNTAGATPSGDISITGLPFTSSSGIPNNAVGILHVQANAGSLQNTGAAFVRVGASSATLYAQTQPVTGGVVSMAGSELSNSIVNGSITYFI